MWNKLVAGAQKYWWVAAVALGAVVVLKNCC